MNVEIRREDYGSIPAYALVPISFEVRDVVDVAAVRAGDVTMVTRSVGAPRRKNYDAASGNDPGGWSTRFDVQLWIFLAAYVGASRVGGAIVVAEPTAVAQLDGRPGSAILWDLRVATGLRRRGIGRELLAGAEDAARLAGRRILDVETQHINVAACRLYSDNAYTLTAVIPEAYPEAPGETKLLWSKRLV